mmetsp:Transcript_49/g.107  ORF Transcript_49/g.107 Transcript_49/m.107 type:complete len:222 (-) Transcript_49:561-1226(-)|eukprot:CAMPEP_0201132238 /NCGR_PEP_ID=MMETSP0850-20130426/45220_1 /ASSEMBLY_ACC=CAM_ASM_000622 /TAXON_ID=183588 /ORGANISM="Pseudo-nitzschia fraudulenta, Strain WWA7" /LENGTH=221 /DNA_ID=CAMNT_0047402529 /DNA_START=44 /DNA_END=709 /DNA_ORIENTATION=-
MTVGRSAGSNSLHGTLRFISKTHCSKSIKRRNNNSKKRRGDDVLLAAICTSFAARRSDRLRVVSIHNQSNDDQKKEKKKLNTTSEDKKNSSTATDTQVSKKKPKSNESPDVAEAANDSAIFGTSKNAKCEESTGKQDEMKKAKTITTTTTKLLHPEDLKKYEEATEKQKRALKNIERARKQIYSSQVQQVWGLYTYGLKHVLALNDLSDAPDAILPGNFEK